MLVFVEPVRRGERRVYGLAVALQPVANGVVIKRLVRQGREGVGRLNQSVELVVDVRE